MTGFTMRVLWRLMIIFSLPIQALFFPANAGRLADAAMANPNESIFGVCVFFLIVGSLCGTFYKSPEDHQANHPKALKFLISVFGGVSAFIYVLHVDKQLTLLNPLWIGAVSFLAPAVVQIVHGAGVERFRNFFNPKSNTEG